MAEGPLDNEEIQSALQDFEDQSPDGSKEKEEEADFIDLHKEPEFVDPHKPSEFGDSQKNRDSGQLEGFPCDPVIGRSSGLPAPPEVGQPDRKEEKGAAANDDEDYEVVTVNEAVSAMPLREQDDECPCKEEVEREEALALAKVMEVYDPSLYLEGTHWIRCDLLGSGAYGKCYKAMDVKTGVIMAVKQVSFCRNSQSEQEAEVETITKEIDMMNKLNHPNVVRIMGATRHGYQFNIFLECMHGGSISYLLENYGDFSEKVITSYTLQILRGLAYLHDNHVLHRDLKGANLLVDSTRDLLKIGDFGSAARLASQTTGADEFKDQQLGTTHFMAPEVLKGEHYGRACDIWSVGCVIIEMATTKPPTALIYQMQPPPIPDNLSPLIKGIVLRCLEQKKKRPTAKELLVLFISSK